jgi:serine/threonine-protein kinase
VPVSRLLIDAPNRTGHIAISPDGSRMAIVTGQRLMVRALADFTEVPVAGVDFTGLSNPVFSPNGESIVFSVGESIRRVPVGGGVATEIARVAEPPLGLSWDGDSLLAGIGAGGIARLPLDGGAATTLVTLGPSEFAARPQMLPGGKDVLFTFTSGGQRPDWRTSSVVVQSLESGKRDVLVQTGSDGRYVPTGHLVYAVEGVWFGAAFDPRERRLTGLPAPLISGVGRFHRAGVVEPNAMVAFSDNGTLVYGTGPVTLTRRRELVRTDRAGTEQSLKLPPNSYESPRVSPNGKLLAVSAGEGADATVWIYDLSGATALRRLTFSGSNRLPVWAPDGTRVAFQSEGGGGAPGIFVRRVDGSGDAERLTTAEPGTTHVPESWSTDGWLAYSKVTNTGAELWLYSEREKRAMQFGTVQSSDPLNASFSPDGKWLAYTQRWATRTAHVFVQPVPATGALYQISPEGNMGHHPLWSPLGDELLYMGVRGSRMVSTQMTFGSGLSFSNPVPLTPNLPSNTSARGPLAYGITADGRAFIWAKPLDAAVAERDALRVVLGWFSELKRPLPGSR